MSKNNADEVLMPSLVDRSIFDMTNREELFGDEIFKVKGRNSKEYMLCPTHEELFALLVRNKIRSYKDLHFTLFQLSNKFRDEIHPEYGLIRKKNSIWQMLIVLMLMKVDLILVMTKCIKHSTISLED